MDSRGDVLFLGAMLRKSKPAAIVAGVYLLLVFAAMFPFFQEGYIGHGNGVALLLAGALTLPLSYLFLLLNDRFMNANAFYMTGWPYFITLVELAVAAAFNAYVIHSLVAYMHRKWWQ